MPIDLAIEKYVSFSQEVFSDVKKRNIQAEKFMATVFESGMRDIVQSAGFPEDVLMQEDDPLCKSFVVALSSANMTPQIFRTYKVKANQDYDCTVVEAACATTATPNLFKPASMNLGGVSKTFLGASLGYSNPTNLVLEEAVRVFGPSQPVACFVNIGAGHPGHITWESNNSFSQLIFQLAIDCENLAESLVKNYVQIPGLFYRLSVNQGLQKMAMDDWNRPKETQAHSLAYLKKVNVTEDLNRLTNSLHSCLKKTTLGTLNGILSTALLFIVPAPSPLFSGRANILSSLEECFNPDKSSAKMQMQLHCVLHGLEGAGKTQIALQFCHQFKRRFSSMYMIDASSKASIEQFLTLLAQNAKLADTTPAAALNWLCYQKEEWLMVFDNADDLELDLHEFFPCCNHGNILITSRNEACSMYSPDNHYKIEEMTCEDSLAVFYKASQRSKDEEAAANELVQELGYLALAIVQAGSYLYHNKHIQVKEYIESYKEDMVRYLDKTRKQKLNKYQLSVFGTWNLSYQKLDEKAKAILMLFSVLHNSKIPVSMLERAWRNLSNNCEENMQELQHLLQKFVTNGKEWSDKLMKEAIDMLSSYSLVKIRGEGIMLLEIHSLVHSWAFQSLSKEEQEKAKQYGQQLFYYLAGEKLEYDDAAQWVLHLQALMNCLNYKWDNYKMAVTFVRIFFAAHFWTSAEHLQQQLVSTCKQVVGNNSLDTIIAMSNLSMLLLFSGKLEEAENTQQEVLRARMELFGSNDPDTIQDMSNLALILHQAGKLHEAENLEQEVLKVRIASLGSNHPDTIEAMSSLTSIFYQARKLQEAENLQQEVLKVRVETFGRNHPKTIEGISKLAMIFCKAGKLQEAEKLQQEVLKIMSESFGSNHPDTIEAMSNLASTFQKSGKLQAAENLQQKVLKIRTQSLGNYHPDTIEAMSHLALIFQEARKLQEAENLQLEVLKMRMESFGSTHPDTIVAMSNLAVTFRHSGRLEEAENLHQEVLKIRTESFESSHPNTIKAMSNLATTFWKAGKLQEAKNLQQEVLNITTKSFGSNHPDTIQAMSNFAVILRDSGRLKEAEKLHQKVLKIRIESFGSNHPDTTEAMYNLASTFCQAGKLQEAESLNQEVLKATTESFGSNHPKTIGAMSHLALTFCRVGKLQEAENLQEKVLKITTTSFGRNHPDTIGAMSHLASTFCKAGKLQKAENLQQEVLKILIESFGSNHHKTIHAMSNLALTFWKAGKLQEAENLQQKVLKVRMETFGREHSDTIHAMSNLALTFWKAGKLQKAENLQQEVLKARMKTFERNHPDIIQAMSYLALTFWKAGKLQEAENLQQEVLKIMRETFGNSHPDTVEAMSNLALTFWKAGKWQKAEKLRQEMLKARKRPSLQYYYKSTLQVVVYAANI
ncbi:hypothetical protein C0993_000404 [Termitomyces sp. T159_Od127]|nr:hypothetical protein C0993_000404 [Termitomyces sp. T159_Od127]